MASKEQELDAVRIAIYGMLAQFADSEAINDCKREVDRLLRDVQQCTTEREKLIKSCAMLIACAQLEKVMPDIG